MSVDVKEEITKAIVAEKSNLNLLIEGLLGTMGDGGIWVGLAIIIIKLMVILIGSFFAVRVIKNIVTRMFKVKTKGPMRYTERRQKTIVKLLENVVAYVIYFAALLAILSTFSINVAGLLAGAGILGLAVGFGAQNLVKDVITGFFIIFEDQFSVGDFVRIGTAEGTVEEIGLRTSKVKAFTGEMFIIPNGNIMEVVNYSINNSLAIVDLSISYESDIDKTEELIRNYLPGIKEKYEEIVSEPEVLGVQMLGASEIVIRVIAETKPMEHFGVSRKLRKDLKMFLDENGIEIPYPRMVMINNEK